MEQARSLQEEEVFLIARCLRRESAAWKALFDRYHPQLLMTIRLLLRNGGAAEEAEEIAAAVWSELCAEGYPRLRQYTLRGVRFYSFLTVMARREISRQRRSERSRRARECLAARREATWDELDRELTISEILATLTGREREFLQAELMPEAEPMGSSAFSPAYEWKLRSRVLKKFRTYFLQKQARPDDTLVSRGTAPW